MSVVVRPATRGDVPAIWLIYAFHVVHGTASWAYEPPDQAEMASRLDELSAAGFPFLVAERDGQVLGYAYASSFRPRVGYRFTCEDSVYVAPQERGKGVGRMLLTALIDGCKALGLRRMLAVVGDSDNVASIALHQACGFQLAAAVPGLGWKAGRSLDWVLLARDLATDPLPADTLEVRPEDPSGAVGQALLWGLALERTRGHTEAGDADPGNPAAPEASTFDPGDLSAGAEPGAFMVARLGGQPVGCGSFEPGTAGEAHVVSLYAVPWVRGRGVLEAIHAALAAEATQQSLVLRP